MIADHAIPVWLRNGFQHENCFAVGLSPRRLQIMSCRILLAINRFLMKSSRLSQLATLAAVLAGLGAALHATPPKGSLTIDRISEIRYGQGSKGASNT